MLTHWPPTAAARCSGPMLHIKRQDVARRQLQSALRLAAQHWRGGNTFLHSWPELHRSSQCGGLTCGVAQQSARPTTWSSPPAHGLASRTLWSLEGQPPQAAQASPSRPSPRHTRSPPPRTRRPLKRKGLGASATVRADAVSPERVAAQGRTGIHSAKRRRSIIRCDETQATGRSGAPPAPQPQAWDVARARWRSYMQTHQRVSFGRVLARRKLHTRRNRR